MIGYKILQKKRKLLIFVIIIIIILSGTGYVSARHDLVNIYPRSIKFTVEDPGEDVSANHKLIVDRKKRIKGNIYYRVIDRYVAGINLAEYIMAKTPYAGDYQKLDRPVRFLSSRDERVEIKLRFRVDDIFWERVPDGNYKLQLVSYRGESVKIKVQVKKGSLMTISPGAVNILADSGPGIYQSQTPLNLYINNNNNRWNVDIEASPLFYHGYYHGMDKSRLVLPEDIYLSVGRPDNFISLDNIYRIYGYDYGRTAELDIYFQVDVGSDLFAGNYSGQVVLTISEY